MSYRVLILEDERHQHDRLIGQKLYRVQRERGERGGHRVAVVEAVDEAERQRPMVEPVRPVDDYIGDQKI